MGIAAFFFHLLGDHFSFILFQITFVIIQFCLLLVFHVPLCFFLSYPENFGLKMDLFWLKYLSVSLLINCGQGLYPADSTVALSDI